jgi:uncharacterized protein (TIGR02145 family)
MKKITFPGQNTFCAYCLLLAVAAMAFVACSKDEALTLSTDKTNIDAAYSAGSYVIAITSNTDWTVEVSSSTTWCTLSPPPFGTGNGEVTVNIAESPLFESRTATINIAAGGLSNVVTVTQGARITPTNAASTTTWTFGTQTWSDAIHCPECDKDRFSASYTDPQCRSFTYAGKSYYYYNWVYVNANKENMCPAPWRVPTSADFNTLESNSDLFNLLRNAWGYTGAVVYGDGEVTELEGGAMYWSSTADPEDSDNAYLFVYGNDMVMGGYSNKRAGLHVRCVK